MPTKTSGINISIPSNLYQHLVEVSKRDKMNVEAKIRQLLRDALEHEEERMLSTIAEFRLKNTRKWYSQKDVWKKFNVPT